MSNTIRIGLLLLALLFSAGRTDATEYFVGPLGADTNDGLSRETAFLTIQRGVDALEPGDTLTIGPGEYFGAVKRDALGGPDAVTTIRAAIPGTVLLRGDVTISGFRKLDGYRFVYVAEFDRPEDVQTVNELDNLTVLVSKPNVGELEYCPGTFYHDREAGKLYIASSDWNPPTAHRYSASVTSAHGVFLSRPTRVVIEGIAVTGFNSNALVDRSEGGGGAFGILLSRGKACVIRDCHAYLNGYGIGIHTHVSRVDQAGDPQATGDNVIERCAAWSWTPSTSVS